MYWLLPDVKGPRVLLYHHIWPGIPDRLTVTPVQLETHFEYLYKNGYKTVFVSELLKAVTTQKALSSKTVVLTFDNGYQNQVAFVAPLLEKYGFCACLFLSGEKVMAGARQNKNNKTNYLLAENIRRMNLAHFEFGLHVCAGMPIDDLSDGKIRSEIFMNQQVFSAIHIPIIPVISHSIAGAGKATQARMNRILQDCGIMAAFSPGFSTHPPQDRFTLSRIEITGFDNPRRFHIKLKKGRLLLF